MPFLKPGIGDHHVNAARLGGGYRIVDDRGAVRACVLRHHRHAVALTPDLQLLHRRCAEGVARRQPAHLGGDEFAVLVPSVLDEEEMFSLASSWDSSLRMVTLS